MKNSITFKAITVAIGILVAVVIAFTLWLRRPEQHTSSATSFSLPLAAMPVSTYLKVFAENQVSKYSE